MKTPLLKRPSFLNTKSRICGSLMTTPSGSVGTEIWNVSWPKRLSQSTNHENSFCRLWRNLRPFPNRGRVLGARLPPGQHNSDTTGGFLKMS